MVLDVLLVATCSNVAMRDIHSLEALANYPFPFTNARLCNNPGQSISERKGSGTGGREVRGDCGYHELFGIPVKWCVVPDDVARK